MQAVVKLGASAAWRGIIAGRVILEKGLRWSVGNGSQIHIWEDRWIPTPTTFKITPNLLFWMVQPTLFWI